MIPGSYKQWLTGGFYAWLLFALLLLFIPFSPNMPGLTIDASWALALNQAVAQGIAFGRDLIFTLGPYSAIYTKAYHPATAYLMYGGCLYLALSYCLLLALLTRDSAWRWRFALALLFMVMIYSRDALLLSYPLLMGLVVFKSDSFSSSRSLLMAAAAPLGLLVLIKGTMLLFAVLVLLTTSVYLWKKKQTHSLLSFWIAFFFALSVFWCLAHQSLWDLPAYLGNSIALAMGYSEAMASEGNGWEVFAYLISTLGLLTVIAKQPDLKRLDKAFLIALFTLFLFCALKAGFVRHFGHSLIAATAILMAAFFLPLVIQSPHLFPLILLAVVTWFYILSGFTRFSPLTYLKASSSNVFAALKMDARDKNWRENDFNLLQQYLADRVKFPVLAGKTDIYSFAQHFLIASHANWSPRPVFQSYSVFSAAMANKNAAYLAEKGPDNIVFKIEPLDGRLPSLEDGASWPALISAYYPVALVKDFLVLKKIHQPARPQAFTITETHHLNETVILPPLKSRVFVAMDIKPTVSGRLLTWVYKPSTLAIELELMNGDKKHYRLIAGMAKSGFLLSPLIENSKEFTLLFGEEFALSHKRVKSLRVIADGQWQENYTLSYRYI